MISFVLATRNDGYGGEIPGVKNFAMRRLQATVASIEYLDIPHETIVVEWNPPTDHPQIEWFLREYPVRILTVSEGLQKLLDADHEGPPLPFYEYVAKDIGVSLARSATIIVCNPDNIFPRARFPQAVEALKSKGRVLVKAIRIGIHSSHATLPLQKLCRLGEEEEPTATGYYSGAAGDFMGFRREIYRALGGFAMVHANWHVDGDFVSRAREVGIPVLQDYQHYHINHENACVEAEGRPKDFDKVAPISETVARARFAWVDV